MISPCILIPIYNHGSTIRATVETLLPYEMPIVIINDGSDSLTSETLESLASGQKGITLINLSRNLGKGAAVMTGLRWAGEMGFSHALQIDADGQHDPKDLPKLIELATAHPDCIISGRPVYDESVPRHRYLARYLTHVWVWIETLSFQIKDSMCGFRAYPIKPSLKVVNSTNLGARMEFDTEIMVRLFWNGVDPVFLPTKVIYPEGGVSHFRSVEDNARISWMHTKLFFGMLRRCIDLLSRSKKARWFEKKDRGAVSLIVLLFRLWKILGRRVFRAVLKVVVLYYSITSSSTRKFSQAYWQRMRSTHPEYNSHLPPAGFWQTNRHLFSFAEAMLDKLAAWSGDITIDQLTVKGNTEIIQALAKGKGAILITSHFGNTEICLALSKENPSLRNVNALVIDRHAPKFGEALQKINPDARLNIMHLEEAGIDTAIKLQEKIDRGELIAIAADRTPVGAQHRTRQASFLGEMAHFPEGPWILASILQCPVFLLFCARSGEHFEVEFIPFSERVILPRASRSDAIQAYIDDFALNLEKWVYRHPYQWYNFYDFWRSDSSSKQQESEK